MDLISRLNDLKDLPPTRGNLCSFALINSKLSDNEITALNAVLENPDIKHSDIAKVLFEFGYKLDYSTVSRHRRRATGSGCKCPA